MADSVPYLWIETPPIPGCSITVSGPFKSTTLKAVIDTGASHTAIPDYLIGQPGLRKISDRAITTTGPESPETEVDIYLAKLSFLGLELHQAVVPCLWHEVLIGRDILNKWVLLLDGPNRRFTFEVVEA
jgi:predicted aspartyl protease